MLLLTYPSLYLISLLWKITSFSCPWSLLILCNIYFILEIKGSYIYIYISVIFFSSNLLVRNSTIKMDKYDNWSSNHDSLHI
jgi:hypothetical protein